MRPGYLLFLSLLLFLFLDATLYLNSEKLSQQKKSISNTTDILVSGFGLTDLCVSTEARYTRHPAVTDPISPFMDHPGAIEHFPSGSFWGVPQQVAILSGQAVK